ncbi:MAG: 8-amino-7-oxononanoate synthase [Candidatus Binatia bacterium]|nr:8-amino-7-oxononanoate synthase [Candidatus Binatia bacterium]MDG2009387.1 8-amino-7-oxononanoate synthase [Candidatus Binatia bacterium]
MTLSHDLGTELAALEDQDLRRIRRTVGGLQGPSIELHGRRVLCLASNNYLGLAGDPRVVAGGVAALEAGGAGAGASPLISGHMQAHEAFEIALADWQGTEAALVFGSGYHANIGVIGALVGAGDVVFSDELNHASLIDGCRLSKARRVIYRHRDLADLESKLRESPGRRRLIVTDSVFSMDGDLAPLEGLVSLARQYDAEILLDEAHAVGVFGDEGGGYADALGLGAEVAIRMGTLGKAFGSYGAFVSGSRELIDLLVNRARAYVFSTGLPPATVGSAAAALEIIRSEPEIRERLWRNARRLHAGLAERGCAMQPFESPILPVVIGSSADVLHVAQQSLAEGVFAPAIRPPTVAEGTARLRVTPIATHTEAEMDAAAHILNAARERR